MIIRKPKLFQSSSAPYCGTRVLNISYHIGSWLRLGLAAKYLVDEVLEKIENIIINYIYHEL
jgi:hypothetical protein